MKVCFYGTRGSFPVSDAASVKHGGNTTCVRIESDCLPMHHWLFIDAGSGIIPASWAFDREGGKAVTILQTHWHHDHTQGLLGASFPYRKDVPLSIYGPLEHEEGPKEVYGKLMRPPLFPVNMREIGSHMRFHPIEFPNSTVLLIHREGGVHRLTLDEFERLMNAERQLPFSRDRKFPADECMIVHLYRSNHPECTISYRFEEPRTGKVFVFLTDHENQDGIPTRLRAHLQFADLLVVDCQYTDEKYHAQTAGWGHGTPSYVAELARANDVRALGLTHHDPPSTDDAIDGIVATARRHLQEAGRDIPVFGCRDYLTVEVGSVPQI